MERDQQPVGGQDGGNDALRRQTRAIAVGPMLPADFAAVREGSGIRLKVVERDRLNDNSSSTLYVFKHADGVDTSTAAGRDAGFARASVVGQVVAPGKKGMSAAWFLTDKASQSGVFFCYATDGSGKNSDTYLTSQQFSSEILDTSIPDDVDHEQVSESGEEIAPGVVASMVTVSCRMPNPLGSVDRVQLYLKDYTRLGSIEEGESHRYTGEPGGSFQFKVPHALVRRKGNGAITLNAGNVNFSVAGGALLSDLRAGEQVEVAGKRATVQSITDNGNGVLVAGWPGVNVVAAADWSIVPLVTVYLVTVSRGGTRRPDVENAPNKQVLFDGDISAPVAPTVLAATAMGNTIRLDIQQPVGTALRRIHIYRATGSGAAFSSCVERDSINLNTTIVSTAGGILTWSDDKFSTYERENAQKFSYYVTVDNVRGDESAPSTRAEATCRLDSPADAGGTMPARFIGPSLLWNGMFAGTGGPVTSPDAVQDSRMGIARPAGFNQWKGSISGTGSTPGFQNGTEVILGMLGTTGQSILTQRIGAWDSANGRVPKGKMVTFQIKAYHTPGTVDGSLNIAIYHFNGVGLSGSAKLQRRLSDDSLDYSLDVLSIAGTSLLNVPTLYWGQFLLDSSVTTTELELDVWYSTTNYSGVNIVITEPMLSLGDGLPYWSPFLDPNTLYSPPGGGALYLPPGRFTDRDGGSRHIIELP